MTDREGRCEDKINHLNRKLLRRFLPRKPSTTVTEIIGVFVVRRPKTKTTEVEVNSELRGVEDELNSQKTRD